ncbi:MAG: class I tRNA ligase family protein, partial [bacterium]
GRGKSLKELSIEAVKSGQTKIIPERFEKIYFQWMENLCDWCISRQIWFGHQIPVWYRPAVILNGTKNLDPEMYVGIEAPQGEGWIQDPDSLDTWFSSGIWTFSTLGWPAETKDFKTFHPTSVLETGRDIIFFWVARMILMTTYTLGEVPFKTVYLRGLVLDEAGRKMSKSLGNAIDPLVTSDKFGTDATRLALTIGGTPGNDLRLSEAKIEGFRNFANKLWNISRFILSQEGEPASKFKAETLADEWILGRLTEVANEVTKSIESFDFSRAGELLRDFTWSEFADWYLEISKVQLRGEYQTNTLAILRFILTTLLKLWHPFMPFVTEAIWQEAGLGEGLLMMTEWPKLKYKKEAGDFAKIQELITIIRNLRAESNVPAKAKPAAVVPDSKLLRAEAENIKSLAFLGDLEYSKGGDGPEKSVKGITTLGEVYLVIEGAIDATAESARLTKEIEQLEKYVTLQEKKLANEDFVKRAPAAVIEKERQKLFEVKDKIAKFKFELVKLGK